MYGQLDKILSGCNTKDDLLQAVVDAPFRYQMEMTKFSLGIIVLLLANTKDGLIHRVALSSTELAAAAKNVSAKRFEDIKIPLDYPSNIIAEAIRTQQPQRTVDWKYLFAPALTAEEARLNQAGGAIACSAVHPLHDVGDGGAIIYSYYQYPEYLGESQKTFMERYTELVSDRLRPLLTTPLVRPT